MLFCFIFNGHLICGGEVIEGGWIKALRWKVGIVANVPIVEGSIELFELIVVFFKGVKWRHIWFLLSFGIADDEEGYELNEKNIEDVNIGGDFTHVKILFTIDYNNNHLSLFARVYNIIIIKFEKSRIYSYH